MHRVTAIAVVFLILVIGKILFKDNNPNLERGMPPVPSAEAKPDAGACIPMDQFMTDYPEATPEESRQMEICNKDRAANPGRNLDEEN